MATRSAGKRTALLYLKGGKLVRVGITVNATTCKTLEDVLAWAHATGRTLVEVVVQDEYTHDVVVARGPEHHVFDTT